MLILALIVVVVGGSGCSVQGRVTVRSPQAMDVDLTILDVDGSCEDAQIPGVSVLPGKGAGDQRTCRAVGTLDPSDELFGLVVGVAEDYVLLIYNPLQIPLSRGSDTTSNPVKGMDVVIAFPGQVVSSSAGSVQGREVHVTNPAALLQPGGLRAVAYRDTGLPAWVWSVALGVAGGLAVGLLLGRSRRLRRRGVDQDDAPVEALMPVIDDEPELPPRESSDQSRWAPP